MPAVKLQSHTDWVGIWLRCYSHVGGVQRRVYHCLQVTSVVWKTTEDLRKKRYAIRHQLHAIQQQWLAVHVVYLQTCTFMYVYDEKQTVHLPCPRRLFPDKPARRSLCLTAEAGSWPRDNSPTFRPSNACDWQRPIGWRTPARDKKRQRFFFLFFFSFSYLFFILSPKTSSINEMKRVAQKHKANKIIKIFEPIKF